MLTLRAAKLGFWMLVQDVLKQFTQANPMTINQSSEKPDKSSFITEMELLEKLKVSRRTVFSWRMAGKIPTVKLGRRTLYHWPSVEAALLRHQRGGEW